MKIKYLLIGIVVIVIATAGAWRIWFMPHGTSAPTLTVTSPAGGEAWQTGETHTISWTTQGVPASDKISVTIQRIPPPPLPAEGQEFDPIVFTNLPNTGSTTWNISSMYPNGTYRLSVNAYASVPIKSVVSGESGTFTLTHPGQAPAANNTTSNTTKSSTSKTTTAPQPANLSYAIVGTGVTTFYDNSGTIASPAAGDAFYGQDADYQINPASYTDNGDGTVTDNVTGLMWQKDMGNKMTLAQAQAEAASSNLGGYHDWRVANVKELFSLIEYTGKVVGNTPVTPFIDTTYFDQPAGGTGTQTGDRPIDAQTLSSTLSVAKTMGGDSSIFGVNFVDGHVKAYPTIDNATGQDNLKYYRLVRGDTDYGVNDFVNNNDGTITDQATGLMWQQNDSGKAMDWESALAYCQDLTLANKSDWRLPSSKELQSIVDYSRSPETTNSPAIDPIFQVTQITDPDGTKDYPYFWSGTTFLNGAVAGDQAAYVAFGRSVGKLANGELVDAHGAGAVRSDPKSGNAADYPKYLGPQNDLQRVFNYARCVRTSP